MSVDHVTDTHVLGHQLVAAALEAGCDRLYTEDMQHGQQIHGLTIRNPFLESPE